MKEVKLELRLLMARGKCAVQKVGCPKRSEESALGKRCGGSMGRW